MNDHPNTADDPACILHAGMIKTGTTSIQSTLFYGPQNDRFRFLTMDSYFGNHLVGSAFAGDFGKGGRFISHGVTDRMAAAVPLRSRRYLEKALESATRHQRLPIISAEIISTLPRDALQRLRTFLRERGWQPRVILYVRAPLDLLESCFQQRLRAGNVPSRIPRKLPEYIEFNRRRGWSEPLQLLDEVFGRENVTLQWFDPRRFPEGCVVRHFCDFAGITVRECDVIRENDSLSLDALRFVYALLLAERRESNHRLARLQWAVLLERLGELRGPSIRFHPSLSTPFVEAIAPEMAWFEQRMGAEAPLSLHKRGNEAGIRSEADLLDFSPASLEWLAKTTGRRAIKHRAGLDSMQAVVDQLESIGVKGSSRIACRIVLARMRELLQRIRVRQRNLE